jgi:serine/threonine protein kinase
LDDSTEYPRRFGRFALVLPVGRGGMGTVDLAVARPSAGSGVELRVVKRLLPQLRAEESRAYADRLRREGELGIATEHRALLKTFAIESEGDEVFLVQEFVHGWNLELLTSRLLAAGEPLSVALCTYVVREVALALDVLHRTGKAVHRDVAPANVMIGYDGAVKLIDFGIAKTGAQPDLTADGVVAIGRAGYAAPEACGSGAGLDPRGDVFALGMVLWELVARRRPLALADQAEKAADADATRAFRPQASLFNPEVSRDLDEVVGRATSSETDGRQRSAADLAAQLTALLPSAFDGKSKLAEVLDRFGDRQVQKGLLDGEVAKATLLLEGAAGNRAQGPLAAVSVRRSRTPVLAAVLGLLVGVVAVGALSWVVSPRERGASSLALARKACEDRRFDECARMARRSLEEGAGAEARRLLKRSLVAWESGQ